MNRDMISNVFAHAMRRSSGFRNYRQVVLAGSLISFDDLPDCHSETNSGARWRQKSGLLSTGACHAYPIAQNSKERNATISERRNLIYESN